MVISTSYSSAILKFPPDCSFLYKIYSLSLYCNNFFCAHGKTVRNNVSHLFLQLIMTMWPTSPQQFIWKSHHCLKGNCFPRAFFVCSFLWERWWLCNSASTYDPEILQLTIYSKKFSHTSIRGHLQICSSTIVWGSSNLEAIELSVTGRTDKQSVVDSYQSGWCSKYVTNVMASVSVSQNEYQP